MRILDYVDLQLTPYTSDQLKEIAQDFVADAKRAIAGESSTLSMFRSLLKAGDISQTDAIVLAIDIGGSSQRAGLFKSESGAVVSVKDIPLVAKSYKPGVTTVEEYCTAIADFITEYVKDNQIQPEVLALGYSYPAKIIENGRFVDADLSELSDEWAKGLLVKNSQVNISEAIRKALEQKGFTFKKGVTLNDSAALLFCNSEARAGVIVGTGFNIAVTDPQGNVYNCEAASFHNKFMKDTLSLPAQHFLKHLTESLILQNRNPEQNVELDSFGEVQASGGYLYKLILEALMITGENFPELAAAIKKIESRSISLFLENDFATFTAETGYTVPQRLQKTLMTLAHMLIGRSIDIVAAEIAGALLFSYDGSIPGSVVVAINGSVAERTPGYAEAVAQKAAMVLGVDNVELRLERSILPGLARAALIRS